MILYSPRKAIALRETEDAPPARKGEENEEDHLQG